jgi:hypothetical protein
VGAGVVTGAIVVQGEGGNVGGPTVVQGLAPTAARGNWKSEAIANKWLKEFMVNRTFA